MRNIGVVLLAAGASTRMGSPKQLLQHRGQPLLRHACAVALSANCGPVIVVLGARAGEIRPILRDLPVDVIVNERWADGIGTSIIAGVTLAACMQLDGVILTATDQIFLTGDVLRRLVAVREKTEKPIVASRYADTLGVPAYFGHELFPALQTLKPGSGCKELILRHGASVAAVDCPEAEGDIDTPADYARLARP